MQKLILAEARAKIEQEKNQTFLYTFGIPPNAEVKLSVGQLVNKYFVHCHNIQKNRVVYFQWHCLTLQILRN